jgi:hypothetical protein
VTSFTYWWLNLSSGLVFNGDEGTLEPSGASRRHGLEFMLKATPLEWLTFTGNVTNTPVAEFFNGAAIPGTRRERGLPAGCTGSGRRGQFTSRLPGEPPQGVNDIHYTPGNPRTFLGGLAYRF